MVANPPPTLFAPSERASHADVQRQAQQFAALPLIGPLLDAAPDFLVVLNAERQIVFGNRSLLEFLAKPKEAVIGFRPGEVLNCLHAFESEGGCGTTEFCRTCGAVNAILSSQRGRPDVQECRIIQRQNQEALDLKVWTNPFVLGEECFTIFAVMNIGDEKRRQALERIFFHDILNTAGGLRGYAQMLPGARPEEMPEYSENIHQMADQLIEEIKAQRQLLAAERGELATEPVALRALTTLREIVALYQHHDVARDRQLSLAADAQEVAFISDRALIGRVIGNMVKNALEACPSGATVTAGCARRDTEVEFWVHNPVYMPRQIQLQVFQRSFSTKGTGRGLGTYSMKLLSERYLNGRVTFASSQADGTTFSAFYPLFLVG